jgi:hypothetical protein
MDRLKQVGWHLRSGLFRSRSATQQIDRAFSAGRKSPAMIRVYTAAP